MPWRSANCLALSEPCTLTLLRAVVRDSFGAPIDRLCRPRLLKGALAVRLSRGQNENSW